MSRRRVPNSFLQIQSARHRRVVAFLQQRGLALSSKTRSSFSLPSVCGSFRQGHLGSAGSGPTFGLRYPRNMRSVANDTVSLAMRAKHRGGWMHNSAGGRRYFRGILARLLTRIQFFLLLGMLSRHKHHMKWSFSGSLCKRDLESVQEEDFLLPLCA